MKKKILSFLMVIAITLSPTMTVFAEEQNIIPVSSKEEQQEIQNFFDQMFQDIQDAYDAILDEEIGYETVVVGQETIVDKEAWTEIIEHNAETHLVEHEAETHEVEHPIETHTEDEDIINENGNIIYSHSKENKANGELHPAYPGSPLYYWREETPEDYEQRTGKNYRPGMNLGYIAINKDSKIVVDKEAWTEIVVDKEAWTETVIDKPAWTETIEHEAETHQEDITEDICLREEQDITGPAIIFVPKEEEPFEIDWSQIDLTEEEEPTVVDPTTPPVIDEPEIEDPNPTPSEEEKDPEVIEKPIEDPNPSKEESEVIEKPIPSEEKETEEEKKPCVDVNNKPDTDAETPSQETPTQPSAPEKIENNQTPQTEQSTPSTKPQKEDKEVITIVDEEVPLAANYNKCECNCHCTHNNTIVVVSPKTGDSSIIKYLIILISCGIGIIICLILDLILRKKNGAE